MNRTIIDFVLKTTILRLRSFREFWFWEVPWAIDFRSGPQVATEAQKVTKKMQKYNVNQYVIEQMSK